MAKSNDTLFYRLFCCCFLCFKTKKIISHNDRDDDQSNINNVDRNYETELEEKKKIQKSTGPDTGEEEKFCFKSVRNPSKTSSIKIPDLALNNRLADNSIVDSPPNISLKANKIESSQDGEVLNNRESHKTQKILLSQDGEVLNHPDSNSLLVRYSNDKSKSPKLEIFIEKSPISVLSDPSERFNLLKSKFEKTKEVNKSLKADKDKMKEKLLQKKADYDLKKNESEKAITALKEEKEMLLKKLKSESKLYKIYGDAKNKIDKELTEGKKFFSLVETENILLREQESYPLRIDIFKNHQTLIRNDEYLKRQLELL